jgi:hypothetical protein
MEARPEGREPSARIATLGGLVAAASTGANALIWFVADRVGRMTIGVDEVVIGSLVGIVGASLVFCALNVWARNPRKIFFRIAIGVLIIYSLGPVSAALAPFMEGAEKFNVCTVLATELMHLVSGLSILWAFTRARP